MSESRSAPDPRAGALIVVGLPNLAPTAAFDEDPLSFEDRVRYQRAIEEVYWRHRIWPAENTRSKPALDEALPDRVLRERVATYLEKSAALELLRSQPLTGEQLQAEVNRISRDTKEPDVLRELFAALDDSPFLVAECLARPLLVDRLTRNRNARDARVHGASGEQTEDDRTVVDSAHPIQSVAPPVDGYELPSPADDGCTADSWNELWYVPSARGHHTAVWTGTEMIVWGGIDNGAMSSGGRYDPTTDSWTATAAGAGVPAATYWIDTEPVPPGICRFYLVRSSQPNVGSWGASSSGAERTAVCP